MQDFVMTNPYQHVIGQPPGWLVRQLCASLEKHKMWFIGLGLLFMALHSALAADAHTAADLPFDSWFQALQTSLTGPFARAVSIIGIAAAGATLIFGNDISAFVRSLVYIVLVSSVLLYSKETLEGLTGEGAEIAWSPVCCVVLEGWV